MCLYLVSYRYFVVFSKNTVTHRISGIMRYFKRMNTHIVYYTFFFFVYKSYITFFYFS